VFCQRAAHAASPPRARRSEVGEFFFSLRRAGLMLPSYEGEKASVGGVDGVAGRQVRWCACRAVYARSGGYVLGEPRGSVERLFRRPARPAVPCVKRASFPASCTAAVPCPAPVSGTRRLPPRSRQQKNTAAGVRQYARVPPSVTTQAFRPQALTQFSAWRSRQWFCHAVQRRRSGCPQRPPAQRLFDHAQ